MTHVEKRLSKGHPFAIQEKDGEVIAYIDMRGNWHCKKGRKKRIVEILLNYSVAFKQHLQLMDTLEEAHKKLLS